MPRHQIQPPTRRIVELDALRALAAINLMLFHFTHVYSVKYGYSSPLGFEFPWGKYGVQLFFMLSGVVNALTILKKRSPGKFLKARCLRILPSYYIVIGLNLVILGCLPLTMNPEWTWSQLLANLTVMPNLFGHECLEPVMWTLQVEVLFYGILLLLFARGWLDRPLKAIGACLAICLAGCWSIDTVNMAMPNSPIIGPLEFVRQLLLLDYFPLFATGILLHEIWRTSPSDISALGARSWLKLVHANRANLGGIACSLAVFHLIDNHGHNPVVSVGLTALLGASLFGRVAVLRWKPLVFISTISYMLYLLHDNLGAVFIYWLNHSAGFSPAVCFALSLPATIVLSAIATFVLERPVTKLLRHHLLDRQPARRKSGSAVTLSPAMSEVVR